MEGFLMVRYYTQLEDTFASLLWTTRNILPFFLLKDIALQLVMLESSLSFCKRVKFL